MKNFCLFISISFVSFSAIGQGIEITPSYGYQFGAKINYGPNYLKMNSSDQFRITVGVETYSGLMAEFSYINMSTELRLKDFIYAPFETKISDLSADWFLIGATRYLKDGKVKTIFYKSKMKSYLTIEKCTDTEGIVCSYIDKVIYYKLENDPNNYD